jgi:beta-aspartyl-dipeptidase (metallo-type)
MFTVVERTGIPITQFIPSHVNQTDGHTADALAWVRRGAFIDIGANYPPANNHARATLRRRRSAISFLRAWRPARFS